MFRSTRTSVLKLSMASSTLSSPHLPVPMLEHHADKENFTTVYTAPSILVKYRQKDNIPNNSRSPWFIPSIGQWCDMLKNICGKDPMTFSRTSSAFEEYYKYGTETLDKLNAQLGKAGRSARKLSADKRRISRPAPNSTDNSVGLSSGDFSMIGTESASKGIIKVPAT